MSTISVGQTSSPQVAQGSSARPAHRGAPPEGIPPGLEAKLDSALESTQLTDEEKASLKEDLKSALDTAFESAGGAPPPPEQIETAVKAVFEEYGLDADALASELRPSGGPPPRGGHTGGGPKGAGEYDDASANLLELIESISSSDASADESETESDAASKIGEQIFSALVGFNEYA